MRKTMILAVAGLALLSCKKENPAVTDTPQDSLPPSKTAAADVKQCYLQVTSRKADYGDRKTLSDSILFNIERHEGDSIWGIFHWKPAEKDKKISTYKGILKGDTGTVVANSNAEGMNYNEEVIFTLKDNTLAVKFGEMAEGKDGIWRYKDQSKLSEQLLNKVDCK